MRAKYLDVMPWLDFYCKQNPELCKRRINSREGINFPSNMLPDGTLDSCRIDEDE